MSAPGDDWRGVAAESVDDLPTAWTGLLRRRTRRLLGSLAAPRRGAIALLAIVILVANLASVAVPWLVGVGIDRGIPAARHGDYAPIAFVTSLIIACAVLQALLYRSFVAGSGVIGQEILLELRQRVFAHFQRLSLAFHERYTTGRMISRLTSDLDAINDMFTLGLDTLITAVLSVVSVGVILLVLDWRLGLVCLSGFVPLYFLTRWYQRESSAAYRNTRSAVALLIVHFTESLRGIRAVHAFRREARNDEIFEGLSEGYRTTMTRSFQLLGIYWPGIVLVGNLTTAAVLLYGGSQVIGRSMQVGVLASFVLYLRRFFEPLAEVSQFYDSFQGAAAGLEKLAGVLDEEPGVPMPEHGVPAPEGGFGGSVEFRQVHFAYRDGTEVLSGFDLRIPSGQTVALLGVTGAGKSTVARLLARRLRFLYLDTGAMYRALTWLALERGADRDDGAALGRLAEEHPVSFDADGRVTIAGADVTEAIREPRIDRVVSAVARHPEVRRVMRARQRELGEAGDAVIEGRDIGTAVAPDAEVKVFLVADEAVRAARRAGERPGVDPQALAADLRWRDERDAPQMERAADAVVIDTTDLTIDGVVERIETLVRERAAV